MRARATPLLAGLLFFLSGAAALVYQVAWQRLLALHSGIGLYSVALIVAAFMAGLGLGSQVGGVVSARVGAGTAFRLFATIELAIALFGAASPWIYYDWLYPRAVHLPSPSWQGGALHFLALLPPTALMGMSLPFLVRALVRRVEGAVRRIGWLYGVNVLGAAFGALLAPWVLFPRVGLRDAVLVAALFNLTVGLGSLVLARLAGSSDLLVGQHERSVTKAGVEPPGSRPLRLWMALYALSGFVALSLEIVWFRLVDVAVKSTAFTFGTVLAVYLLGSGLGALAGAPLVGRLRRPLRSFLLVQCTLTGVTAVPIIAAVTLPPDAAWLDWYVEYWAGYGFFALGHEWDAAHVTALYLMLPLLLFFVPTVLMGLSFPILQRAVQDEVRTSGRKVGLLQAANIAGCMAGSLLVGLGSLRWLGTAGTLRALVGVGILFGLVGWRTYGRAFALPVLALTAAVFALPDGERLWRRLHGLSDPSVFGLFDEDATSVVSITSVDGPGRYRLSINGKGNSWLPYGDIHTLLGALPALVHPGPRDVAVIGLGSGDTVRAVGCRPEIRSIAVFEIASPQPRILRRLAAIVDLPELEAMLADPRVRVSLADGRHALESGETAYDLIETDAIWAQSAGSGNLYSLEFFAAAARRLRQGGIMCTWAPTPRVHATFRRVFPHTLELPGGAVLIGSLAPLSVDPVLFVLRADGLTSYLGVRGARHVRHALRQLRVPPPSPDIALNRDLFPRDEYAVK